jgi:hypothetical protein
MERRMGWPEATIDIRFVARDGLPVERLLDWLGVIIRDECDGPVRLRLREVVRGVMVALGSHRYRSVGAWNVPGDPRRS